MHGRGGARRPGGAVVSPTRQPGRRQGLRQLRAPRRGLGRAAVPAHRRPFADEKARQQQRRPHTKGRAVGQQPQGAPGAAAGIHARQRLHPPHGGVGTRRKWVVEHHVGARGLVVDQAREVSEAEFPRHARGRLGGMVGEQLLQRRLMPTRIRQRVGFRDREPRGLRVRLEADDPQRARCPARPPQRLMTLHGGQRVGGRAQAHVEQHHRAGFLATEQRGEVGPLHIQRGGLGPRPLHRMHGLRVGAAVHREGAILLPLQGVGH